MASQKSKKGPPQEVLLAGGVALLSTPDFRKAATQIGNTESYHSGIIRTLLYSVINETPAYNNTVAQITSAIVAVLNQLSGEPQLKYTLTNTNGVSLSNVDSSGYPPALALQLAAILLSEGAAIHSGCSASSAPFLCASIVMHRLHIILPISLSDDTYPSLAAGSLFGSISYFMRLLRILKGRSLDRQLGKQGSFCLQHWSLWLHPPKSSRSSPSMPQLAAEEASSQIVSFHV